MTSGSCPRCRSMLEGDASFCHSCGLDLASATAMGGGPASASPQGPVTGPSVAPSVAPFPMLAAPGMEVPVNPMGHERAMASLASVMMFFTASIVFLFALIYITSRAYTWEEDFTGEGWTDRQVLHWEWVLASCFMFATFGSSVAGGVAAAKVVRFPLAMVSSVLLLISTVIILVDFQNLSGESYTQIVFLLVLSLTTMALLWLSRPAFRETRPRPGRGPPPYAVDNYGWSTTPPPGGDGP